MVWEDQRNGNSDIYAQRIDISGTVKWTVNGVAVCTADTTQFYPAVVSDGFGGSIIVWPDYRNAPGSDIYAQKLDKNGTPLWTADGIQVCGAAGDQSLTQITTDMAYGAIITWRDTRVGYAIYAQRVNGLGVVQWTTDGEAICTASGTHYEPQIVSDDSHGAIVTWRDGRGGSDTNIYAQRIDLDGLVQWTVDGEPVCTAAGPQENPQIVADGTGGAIIAWDDDRSLYADIYAQKIDQSGTVEWTADGVALCKAYYTQTDPYLCSDDAGGAIVTWRDLRETGNDSYAQRVERNGYRGFPAPDIEAIRDVPGDEGGVVNLSWYASRLDPWPNQLISHYTVWRAIDPVSVISVLDGEDLELSEAPRSLPFQAMSIVRRQSFAGQTFFWKLVTSVDAYYLDSYSEVVPTLFDSTETCTEYSYFQVIAHTDDPLVYWISAPDSGYSVDNLPPAQPQGLAGDPLFLPGGLLIFWNPNEEADLAHYTVYRGVDESFVPDENSRLGTPADTSLFDSEWGSYMLYFYKVTATDVHGNESLFALLRPEYITDVDSDAILLRNGLSQNVPNPFNPSTRIAYSVEEGGRLMLRIFDVSGRLVRVLANEWRTPGLYSEVWDGRDDAGHAVASGVYFYQVRIGAYSQTRRMVLIR
jgi:hypothetical protein